jgi:glyoxylase-like metal-dependent hydrolase (beta-lactamase superfamily II)
LIDARFPCEIAEDVWIIPDRRIFLVPNVGIVVGKKAALIIDCGLGPQCGQKVLETAERIAPGRQLILTQTHAHPEHAFGAVAFKDRAQIFLNRQQNDYLVKTGPALLKLFRERFREEERELMAGTEIVPATETYDGASGTLDLGGRRVEFHAVGTAHSPGDQIISLPKEKILFSGDLIEERMFPIVPFLPPTMPKRDIDVANWVQALSNIEQSGSSIIVPGHGSLGQAEIARSLLVYFADLQARVRRLSGTESIEALISELKPQIERPIRRGNMTDSSSRPYAILLKLSGTGAASKRGQKGVAQPDEDFGLAFYPRPKAFAAGCASWYLDFYMNFVTFAIPLRR